MQKKQTILVVASLLVVVLSVTLAYFTAQIIGKGKDISVGSTKLQIIFTDTDGSISGTNIEPGWSITKKFTIKNNSNATYRYDLIIQNLVNTFVTEGYLQYKITSDNNGLSTTDYVDVPKSETATDIVLGSASIEVGVTQTYTIEFIYKNDENVDQSADMNKKLSGTIFITEGSIPTLTEKILEDNPTISERTSFDTPYTDNVSGTLFTSTESIAGSTPVNVYYYAGSTANNWVKFGGFYWRIIRTNADGGVRLLYQGLNTSETSPNIGTSKFNANDNDPMYAGYKYGTSGSLENNRTNTNDSTIKTFVDTWYKNNLLTNYDKYISKSAVYCNDRSVTSGTYNISNEFNYGGETRLYTNKTPTYNCDNIKDAFSVNNIEAKLDYPIALMTADEVAYAGGVNGKSVLDTTYIWFMNNNKEYEFVTMTPNRFISSLFDDVLRVEIMVWSGNFLQEGSGLSSISEVSMDFNVRPVISLSSHVEYLSGDGSPENPYEIETK